MDKRTEISQWLAKNKGIVDPAAVDAEIAKMAAMAPAAQVTEQGASTDVDKAYITMTIQSQGAVAPTGSASPAVSSTQPVASMTAAEELRLKKTLYTSQTDRMQVSENTTIEAIIVDRPAPSAVIPAGSKGVIAADTWEKFLEKMNSADGFIVLPDDDPAKLKEGQTPIASTTNFEKIKAAAAAGTPLDVYVGEQNRRAIGYQVKQGTTTGQEQTPVFMNRDHLLAWMTTATLGYTHKDDNKASVIMRKVKGRTNVATGKTTSDHVVLADKGAKEADIIISRDVQTEKEAKTLKTALNFRIQYKNKTLADGLTPKTGIMRLSLKGVEVFKTSRKPELQEEFGSTDKTGGFDGSSVPDANQLDKLTGVLALSAHTFMNPEGLADKKRDTAARYAATYNDAFQAFANSAAAGANPPA